jgi:4-hydroxybenzoate polyprenyltransferase
MALFRNARITLEMIKWEHSIFALPFALTGAMLAANGWPQVGKLFWIIFCMISARSAAMAFNRWADAQLDAANPRTAGRAIPAGLLTRSYAAQFTIAASVLFLIGAWQLNRLTLLLSPIVLIVLFGYSYTKRFTRWSHLFLGLALGIAPAGAWIAVRGSLDPRILLLCGAVLLWVAGFDVLYACQDFEHDCAAGLHSIPQSVGIPGAFWIARIMHAVAFGLLCDVVRVFHLGSAAMVGAGIVGLLLVYEHALVSPRRLERLNAAFFTMN